MNRPEITIHNAETNEIIVREMDDIEYAEHLERIAQYEAIQAEAEAKAAQRQAVLNRLGITEEEARILLGGN